MNNLKTQPDMHLGKLMSKQDAEDTAPTGQPAVLIGHFGAEENAKHQFLKDTIRYRQEHAKTSVPSGHYRRQEHAR